MIYILPLGRLPRWLSGKGYTANAGDAEMRVQSLGQEDLLEQKMATHSSIVAWNIPWTEEPDSASSWGCKESDTAEHRGAHTHTTPRLSECQNTLLCLKHLQEARFNLLTSGFVLLLQFHYFILCFCGWDYTTADNNPFLINGYFFWLY